MKRLITIVILLAAGCNQIDSIDKDKITATIGNYYEGYAKDVEHVDYVIIDSIVPATEKKHLEDSIFKFEKKLTYFIEAKDDEYADSAAKTIEKLQQELPGAENKRIIYYTIYYTVRFVGIDMIPRKRHSNLNMTPDYKIRNSEPFEKDKIDDVKAVQE